MVPDVVVIGGGIIGCACAYYLSLKGLQVHLLEKGAPGSGASKAGMCHIVTWEEPPIHLKLELASKKLYDGLISALPFDIEYRSGGSLAVVDTEKGLAGMAAMVMRLQAGGHNCQLMSREDMLSAEPNLAGNVAGGAFFADDIQVNPLKATLAFAAAAKMSGARIQFGSAVTSIELDPYRQVQAVWAGSERIITKHIVIAAGAWSGAIGVMTGVDIPIVPRKGHLALTAPVADDFFHHKTIFSAGYLDAVSGNAGLAVTSHIQQTAHGNLLLGSSRQFTGFGQDVDPAVLVAMLKQSIRFFPFLGNVKVIRTWAGLRPYTPDILPIISAVQNTPGLFIAAGHEGLGITEAPITGKLISQLVCGEQPEIGLELLSAERFGGRKSG